MKSFLFFLANIALAQGSDTGIVPCDTNCDWNGLVQLVNNFINYLLYLSAAIATISFTWAGILYLFSAGKEGQVTKAKKIFSNVLIGLAVALAAWLIVHEILLAVGLRPDASLLQQ